MTIVAKPKSAKGKLRRAPEVPGITRPMTYEEYLAGPEEMARYDILDGWKVYRLYGDNLVPSPTRKHQRTLGRLLRRLQDYETQSGRGEAIAAPCDVQITYQPLRSRQPDLLFISRERLEQNEPANVYAPLSPAPELVVEIASPSDTPPVLADKIADYHSAGVQEVWVVRPHQQTVEVIRLAPDGTDAAAMYHRGEAAISAAFDGLAVAVDTIFEE